MKKLLALLPLLSSASLFAQGAAPAREGNFMQTLIMIGIAIVFFYFILWRPERKRRKALEAQRDSMKQGDKVTAMGIVGTIDKIQDKTVILKMVDGSKIEVLKGAISEVMTPGEEPKDISSK
jgi:preprotein translocase subunit YajC